MPPEVPPTFPRRWQAAVNGAERPVWYLTQPPLQNGVVGLGVGVASKAGLDAVGVSAELGDELPDVAPPAVLEARYRPPRIALESPPSQSSRRAGSIARAAPERSDSRLLYSFGLYRLISSHQQLTFNLSNRVMQVSLARAHRNPI